MVRSGSSELYELRLRVRGKPATGGTRSLEDGDGAQPGARRTDLLRRPPELLAEDAAGSERGIGCPSEGLAGAIFEGADEYP
jgi:hypothetical protein